MIRKLLFALIPFLAPFVLYGIYRLLAKKAQGTGKRWDQTPWFWLTASGIACAVVSLGTLALLSGAPPGSTYQPAVQQDDGTITPSRFD